MALNSRDRTPSSLSGSPPQDRPWRPGPRSLLGSLLGLAIGVLLLALAARSVELAAVWAAVRQARLGWVALALLTVLATTAAKVGRWRGLFPHPRRLRPGTLARALLISQLVNALLPARVGEVARFYVLGRDEALSRATIVGTIAAEKAFDVLFLLIAAGVAAALTASLPAWAHAGLGTAVALGAAVVAPALLLPPRRLAALQRCLASRLPRALAVRLGPVLQRAVLGLQGLRRPRLAARACAWSAAVWALAASTNLALFRALHLSLSTGPALLLLTLLHIGMAPPSAPGRIGVFHAITLVALRPFDIDPPTALAAAALLHALVYGPQLLLGAAALALRPPRREVSL